MKDNSKNIRTQLSTYEPPPSVWAEIDNTLTLREGLQSLPTYQPPEVIWENLNADLPVASPKIFWWKKLSIAAGILFLIGMFWWYKLAAVTEPIVHYTEELIDHQLLVPDWDEDDSILLQIEEICRTQNYACKETEFSVLAEELQELNAAKSSLKEAISSYGKDTELITQLAKIELERTAVLNKMIANIL